MKLLSYIQSLFDGDSFNFRLFRLIERLLKFMVIGCDALMTLHCAVLLSGHRLWLTELVAGYSVCGFIALFFASFLLRFCWRYRACLVHDFVVYICIVYEREFGFGLSLPFFRWSMFSLGVLLIGLAIESEARSILNSRKHN